jgi:hypothetical protein
VPRLGARRPSGHDRRPAGAFAGTPLVSNPSDLPIRLTLALFRRPLTSDKVCARVHCPPGQLVKRAQPAQIGPHRGGDLSQRLTNLETRGTSSFAGWTRHGAIVADQPQEIEPKRLRADSRNLHRAVKPGLLVEHYAMALDARCSENLVRA